MTRTIPQPAAGRGTRSGSARHRVAVAAPARTVYGIVADVSTWPRIFPPTVHAERVDGDGRTERIRLWATAGDTVKTWTSRRELDDQAMTAAFRQEIPQSPVAAMSGTWTVTPTGEASCEVILDHEFTADSDAPEALAWIEQAVDRNSNAELAALRSTAEAPGALDELLLTFEDAVFVDGPLADVYDFVWQAHAWPQRLPHVSRVDLGTPGPDLQVLEMDTKAKDGSRHTTKSVRVGFAPGRIVYKQLQVPAMLTAHTGEWVLTETGDSVHAVSRHTIVVRRDAIADVLGPDATVDDALAYARAALGTNSLITLRHAKEYAEHHRPSATG